MPKKTKKKRIFLWVLLIILVLLIVVIAVPIATLYAQYQSISYVPSVPVERPDSYVIPEYPEVIPGSEGITDFPEDPEVPVESPDETQGEVDTDEATSEESNTELVEPETEMETETETSEPPSESSTPETLPPVIYVPTETTPPSTQKPTAPQKTKDPVITAPKNNSNNSFGNSSNAISVYGRTPIYKVDQIDSDIINILVLGTDSRNVVKDRGRSDTMIVVSYNKKSGEIKMVSFLRDMLVPIEGYDWNRINTAYFFDGVGLSINTVNQLFGLDIQHFVVIDLNGARDFIDYIGGVKITLSESEARVIGVTYSKDPILLDGATALLHMRNRSSDSDFGRTERQREVIVAVLNKILSEKSLTEILDITKYAMGMVKTNISATTLTSLATSIVGNTSDLSMESQSIPYTDAYQFAWYKKMAILSFDIQNTAERMLEFLYE